MRKRMLWVPLLAGIGALSWSNFANAQAQKSERFYWEADCYTKDVFVSKSAEKIVQVYLLVEDRLKKSGFPLVDADFEEASVLELMFNERGIVKGITKDNIVGIRYTFMNFGFYVIHLEDKGVCLSFSPTLVTLNSNTMNKGKGIAFKPADRRSEKYVRSALERAISEIGDRNSAAKR